MNCFTKFETIRVEKEPWVGTDSQECEVFCCLVSRITIDFDYRHTYAKKIQT